MTSYCGVTKCRITDTTCCIEMSDATWDSQTPQKMFQQESKPEPEAAGEDMCHPE